MAKKKAEKKTVETATGSDLQAGLPLQKLDSDESSFLGQEALKKDTKETVDYEFVIQFSGIDLPGLLLAFTEPLRLLHYNVTNIALASGGGRHTTFITCRLDQMDSDKGRGFNRWKDKEELFDRLNTAVTLCQDNYFESEDRESKDKPEIEINPQDIDDHVEKKGGNKKVKNSFNLHAMFKVKSTPGHLGNIANGLRESYTVTQTFDWHEEEATQTVYMQNRFLKTGSENSPSKERIDGFSRAFFEVSIDCSKQEDQLEKMKDAFKGLKTEFVKIAKKGRDSNSAPVDVEIERFYVKFDDSYSNPLLRGYVFDGDTVWNDEAIQHRLLQEEIDDLTKQLSSLREHELKPLLVKNARIAVEKLQNNAVAYQETESAST